MLSLRSNFEMSFLKEKNGAFVTIDISTDSAPARDELLANVSVDIFPPPLVLVVTCLSGVTHG